MVSQTDKDVEALHELDDLKAIRKDLNKIADDFQTIEKALRNPTQWTISGEHGGGYGENNAGNAQLPDKKILGQKLQEYQGKHYSLTMKLSTLSPSVRKMVEQELRT